MKPNWNWLVAGLIVVGVGVLLFRAYGAASAPLPKGFPRPTAEGAIAIAQYPRYRAATVRVTGDLSSASSRAFSPLFRHISDNEISMTAPVETRYPAATLQDGATEEGDAAVSFLYSSPDIVPKEVAQNIQVTDIPPITVVSIGVRGSYDYASFTEGIRQLKTWLDEHPEYAIAGAPRRLFYDGPYVPDPLKRSDIQIPVER